MAGAQHRPEVEWREDRERDLVERHIPVALLIVAAFEAIMAARNAMVLTGLARVVMPLLQVVFALMAVAGWWTLRGPDVTPQRLQRGVGAVVIILGLALPLEQALTGNSFLSANLGLVLVAAGAVLLSRRVFAVTACVLIAAWAAVLLSRQDWSIPAGEQVLFVAVSLGVAALVFWNRTTDRRALTGRIHNALENSVRDDLTGLWNRRGARQVGQVLLSAADREGDRVWCIFFDVRGLKVVNDGLGHDQGDALLRGVADALEAVVADPGVIVARWGGDEFCLLGAGEPPDAVALAASVELRVRDQIGELDRPWGLSPGLSVMAAAPGDQALWTLVKEADVDMYRRRDGGGSLDEAARS